LGISELARLEALLRTSPDLLGARLLASGVARLLDKPDQAIKEAKLAQQIAPHDPRPLLACLQVETEEHRLNEAQETLAKLTALIPGDIREKRARAYLLEARSELEEAYPLRREVAERRPTWRHLVELGILEIRLGKGDDNTRQRLRALLAAQPGNQYMRQI